MGAGLELRPMKTRACFAWLSTAEGCAYGVRGLPDRDLKQDTRDERLGQLGGGTGPLWAVLPKLSLAPRPNSGACESPWVSPCHVAALWHSST